MRTSDRNYLHLEGFEISAGDSVQLWLRPLEARQPLPKLATTGLAVAVAALAIGYLIAPLRRSATEATAVAPVASGAAEERESILDAIRDLDEDFEMGKLEEPDYRKMRLALRAEAVNLLRLERAASSDRVVDGADLQQCPHCEAEVAPHSRFCSQCGAQLIDRESAGETPTG